MANSDIVAKFSKNNRCYEIIRYRYRDRTIAGTLYIDGPDIRYVDKNSKIICNTDNGIIISIDIKDCVETTYRTFPNTVSITPSIYGERTSDYKKLCTIKREFVIDNPLMTIPKLLKNVYYSIADRSSFLSSAFI